MKCNNNRWTFEGIGKYSIVVGVKFGQRRKARLEQVVNRILFGIPRVALHFNRIQNSWMALLIMAFEIIIPQVGAATDDALVLAGPVYARTC
jgi:hypothetical protein